MTLWWAVRRPWYVALALACHLLLLMAVREQLLHLPTVTSGGGVGVKLAVFVPLLVCVVQLLVLERRLDAVEVTAVRPVVRADQAMVVAVGGTVLVLGAALHAAAGIHSALASGRNVLLLLGVALLVRHWYGVVAGVSAATALLFACVVVGRRGPDDPYPWAVPLEPWDRPHAAAASLLVFLAGLAVLGRRRTVSRGD